MQRAIGSRVGAAFLALAIAAPARAEDLAAARAFTTALYAAYQHGEPDYLGKLAERTFDISLLQRIRRDQENTPDGEVGTLDGDPICDCQDAEGLKLIKLELVGAGVGRAQARVTLRLADETRPLALDLVATTVGWRVGDVHTEGTPSLAGRLDAELAARQAPPKKVESSRSTASGASSGR
jgi:hypothetical protein